MAYTDELALVQRYDQIIRILRRPPGLLTEKITDEPLGLAEGVGRTFFVDSGSSKAAATNSGLEPGLPFATLAQALDACIADRGDVIYVAAGHAETYAGAVTWSKAGVTVVGLGQGGNRPTFTFSATASAVAASGASMVFKNLLFLVTAAPTAMFTVTGADVRFEDCEVRNSGAFAPVDCFILTTGAARAEIRGLRYNTGTNVAANAAIKISAVLDGIKIVNCDIFGDFADACIGSGSAFTNGLVSDCRLVNLQSGDHSIEFTAASTGDLIRNMYHNNMTQQTGVDPGSMFSFECYQDDVIDTSAILTPVIT